MDYYVPDYESEDDGIYNQLPALSPIINGPILLSSEVDLLEMIWRKGNVAPAVVPDDGWYGSTAAASKPLKVFIQELEMELWLHRENKLLETACMDPMMSVNYIMASMKEPLPIMELLKENEMIDDDQMLISVVRGKVFENSKELMAVVEDSTNNVAPPPMVEMAASDQASSCMSGGKKRKPVITEAPPSDPVAEVVGGESREKEESIAKTAPLKKTRAASVHNLSERRRRGRINERMKTLQDLIPKCSKVDKASMLNEAIQYVKSLQNQVKTMSVKLSSMNSMMYPAAPGVPYYTPVGMNLTVMMGAEMAAAGRYAQPMIHSGQVFPSPQVPRASQVVLNPSPLISPVMLPSSSSCCIPDESGEQAPGQPDPALNFTFIKAPNPSTSPDLEAHVFAELKSGK